MAKAPIEAVKPADSPVTEPVFAFSNANTVFEPAHLTGATSAIVVAMLSSQTIGHQLLPSVIETVYGRLYACEAAALLAARQGKTSL